MKNLLTCACLLFKLKSPAANFIASSGLTLVFCKQAWKLFSTLALSVMVMLNIFVAFIRVP